MKSSGLIFMIVIFYSYWKVKILKREGKDMGKKYMFSSYKKHVWDLKIFSSAHKVLLIIIEQLCIKGFIFVL